ncbi:hypothetical protein FIBSPDRAFT_861206, partial [Athelia psychrophila]
QPPSLPTRIYPPRTPVSLSTPALVSPRHPSSTRTSFFTPAPLSTLIASSCQVACSAPDVAPWVQPRPQGCSSTSTYWGVDQAEGLEGSSPEGFLPEAVLPDHKGSVGGGGGERAPSSQLRVGGDKLCHAKTRSRAKLPPHSFAIVFRPGPALRSSCTLAPLEDPDISPNIFFQQCSVYYASCSPMCIRCL